MSFVAYCFRCEKKVSAHTLLDAAKLLVALPNHYDVEVMHTSDSGNLLFRSVVFPLLLHVFAPLS